MDRFAVWQYLSMCLDEYEEILTQKTTPEIAKSVIKLILALPNLKKVTPTYFLKLIESDPDDNKFVDCAFCGGSGTDCH